MRDYKLTDVLEANQNFLSKSFVYIKHFITADIPRQEIFLVKRLNLAAIKPCCRKKQKQKQKNEKNIFLSTYYCGKRGGMTLLV